METGEPKYWEHFNQLQNKTIFIRKLIAQIKRLWIYQENSLFSAWIGHYNQLICSPRPSSPEHEITLHLFDSISNSNLCIYSGKLDNAAAKSGEFFKKFLNILKRGKVGQWIMLMWLER